MTIEEIDLHRMGREDLAKYLPGRGCPERGAKNGEELAVALQDKKFRAVECPDIDRRLAETIDRVLSIDVHLPESDPAMQKVPEKLFEHNSPDDSSPVIITGNSIITHQILSLILGSTGTKAFVLPVDTMGYTVDNAVHENKLTPMAVMRALTDSGISRKTSSRKALLPGAARDQKSSIERITRWGMEVGPVSGFELPLYLLGRP